MTITLKISENTKQKMIEYFEDKKREKTPAYAVFQADEADSVVTLYESGKVVFQGISADIDANMWKEMERHLNPTKKIELTNSEEKKKDKKTEEIHKDLYYIDSKIDHSSYFLIFEIINNISKLLEEKPTYVVDHIEKYARFYVNEYNAGLSNNYSDIRDVID